MDWQERVNEGPTPQQLQDQITILQSQLRATDEENKRLRSLGETDIKEMVERAVTKFELALEVIKQALQSAPKEKSDERKPRPKRKPVLASAPDQVSEGRHAPGPDSG